MLGDCPAGLETPTGDRNRRKATVKIQRNAPSWLCHETIPKVFKKGGDIGLFITLVPKVLL